MPLGAKHRFESDFAKDIQLIMAGCNASTQPLFQAFVAKIGDRLQHLEALIPKCTKSITPAVDCGVDSAKLISGSQLIAAFDKTQGKIPKCKLRFEFYSEFIALISQSKHSENDKKTIIEYANIAHVICVPDKRRTVTLYISLKAKIPLKWRKQSIENVLLEFDDWDGVELEDGDYLNFDIKHTDKLPDKLRGTEEELFCRVLSDLSGIRIDRHNKMLFQSQSSDTKERVYFIEPSVNFNKCQLFPLRCGLLLIPKPLRFVPRERIKYFEFIRRADYLKNGEMEITLRPEAEEAEYVPTGNVELDKKAERARKKRMKENTINLNMLTNAEMAVFEAYFQRMHIAQGEEAASEQEQCQKKMEDEAKDTDSAVTEKESGDEDEDDDDDMSSDDEQYDPNEENTLSDSDAVDSDAMDSEGDQEMDDEEDIDLKDDVVRNCRMAEKGESIVPKEITNRRKRKRTEMEMADVVVIDGDSDDLTVENQENRSPWKRPKMSHNRMGRKSTNFGQNGNKIVSKAIDKKQNAEHEGKEPSVEIISVHTPKKKKKRSRKHSNSSKKKRGEKKKGSKRSKKKKIKGHEKAESASKQKKISDLFKRAAI